MNRRTLISLACGAALVLAACGDDDDAAGDTTVAAADTTATGDTAAPTESVAPGEIVIEGAWARTSPMMATAGAAYMTITSPVDDRLVAASVDATVAGKVELHETKMVEDGSMTEGTGMAGMPTDTGMDAPAMEMVPVEAIELPAGTAVALAPGGLHIMLLDLVTPLELGQTITITLTFEQAGEIAVPVTVADEAP